MTGPFPCAACPLRCNRQERLGDLEVYTLLITLANALDHRSSQCWLIAAATALSASATMLRTLGSGFVCGK